MRHKFLIILTSLAFLFSIGSFTIDNYREKTKQDAYYHEQELSRENGGFIIYGPYCFPDYHPLLLLFITVSLGLGLASLFIFRRPRLSYLLSVATLSGFIYWFVSTQHAISVNETIPSEFLNRIMYRANDFDVLVFGFVLLISIRQLPILWGAFKDEIPLP